VKHSVKKNLVHAIIIADESQAATGHLHAYYGNVKHCINVQK